MSGRVDLPDRMPDFVGSLFDAAQLVREIDEPIRQSAPMMFERARDACEPKTASDDCQAFHAVWQYLRLADTNRHSRVDGPLFVAAAEQLARDGQLGQVLVSAAADYSLLAHLAFGARRGGAVPAIDVVDRCETALFINDWYARCRGLNVRTFRSDIFVFRPDCQYDLICTHAFLHWHPLPDRARLFRIWRDWLAPGGHLCFSERTTTDSVPYNESTRSRSIRDLQIKTIERLASAAVPLPCPEREFLGWVERYGFRRRADKPAMPLETIRSWIADAGLELEAVVPVAKALRIENDASFIADAKPSGMRMWFQIRRPS